jgi:peptidyl-dipeptidase Dcp
MKTRPNASKAALLALNTTIVTVAIAICSNHPGVAAAADLGPSNPFFAPSTLPFQAPPFDKIRNEDFQPAIEAGIARQEAEIERITDNPDAPTFENTMVAMEKSGQLLDRVMAAFSGITGANTNDTLQKVRTIEACRPSRFHFPQHEAVRSRGNDLQAARHPQT